MSAYEILFWIAYGLFMFGLGILAGSNIRKGK
jgi:hypothetical protein